MATIKKPKEFRLSLIKVNSSGLTVGWTEPENDTKRDSTLTIHPDFKSLLTKCEGFLAEYYGVNEDHVSLKEIKVHYYEDEKGESLLLSGNYSHPDSGQTTGIKTAKMQLHTGQYSFESEIKQALSDLQVEASEYIFDLKSIQEKMDLKVA